MEILPGVKIHPAFRAHTAGSQLLEVPTSVGKLVFGSDAYSSWEGIRDWMVANVQQTDSVQQFLAYEKCYKITGGYENCVAAHEPLSYTDKYPLTKNSWTSPTVRAWPRSRSPPARVRASPEPDLRFRCCGESGNRLPAALSRAQEPTSRAPLHRSCAGDRPDAGERRRKRARPERLRRAVPLARPRGHVAERRRRTVPQLRARRCGRSARPQPPAPGDRSRSDALTDRRAQLDARSPGSDHRRRVRARLRAGRPKRGLRRPERRVPLRGWPVAPG